MTRRPLRFRGPHGWSRSLRVELRISWRDAGGDPDRGPGGVPLAARAPDAAGSPGGVTMAGGVPSVDLDGGRSLSG